MHQRRKGILHARLAQARDECLRARRRLALVLQYGSESRDMSHCAHSDCLQVSFLWKGRDLERRLGSVRFFCLLIVFTILTSCTYLGLNLALFEVTRDRSYLKTCAVGFSGVIFALKVLTTHYTPSHTSQTFIGIPVPSKYAFWAELVLISLISPNASFVGHLAGILVGLMYTKGPLKWIFDFFEGTS